MDMGTPSSPPSTRRVGGIQASCCTPDPVSARGRSPCPSVGGPFGCCRHELHQSARSGARLSLGIKGAFLTRRRHRPSQARLRLPRELEIGNGRQADRHEGRGEYRAGRRPCRFERHLARILPVRLLGRSGRRVCPGCRRACGEIRCRGQEQFRFRPSRQKFQGFPYGAAGVKDRTPSVSKGSTAERDRLGPSFARGELAVIGRGFSAAACIEPRRRPRCALGLGGPALPIGMREVEIGVEPVCGDRREVAGMLPPDRSRKRRRSSRNGTRPRSVWRVIPLHCRARSHMLPSHPCPVFAGDEATLGPPLVAVSRFASASGARTCRPHPASSRGARIARCEEIRPSGAGRPAPRRCLLRHSCLRSDGDPSLDDKTVFVAGVTRCAEGRGPVLLQEEALHALAMVDWGQDPSETISVAFASNSLPKM